MLKDRCSISLLFLHFVSDGLLQVLARGLELCKDECEKRGVSMPRELVLWVPRQQTCCFFAQL